MKKETLAILGGGAAFDKPLPVGQLYFPSWDRYKSAMHGIFQRKYYTNQGPLVQELEHKLERFLGVKNVICVTNGTIGLMMASEAMMLSGKVILPSFTFIASAQALAWAGIDPVFCDIDPNTHQLDVDKLDALIDNDVTAIMGVNLWGGACDTVRLEKYAQARNLKLFFDSAQAFGSMVGETSVANFGSVSVFSFHATKVVSATEGGCLATNDDALAAKLRNIRSSYGAGAPVPVVKTSNGRMSEAQAAIALMSLEDFPQNQSKNEMLFNKYKKCLKDLPGIELIHPAGVTFSNYQYVVCEIDEKAFGMGRDTLLTILNADNIIARRYFYPGVHRSVGFESKYQQDANSLTVTEEVCESAIQFPIGALVDESAVDKICGIIALIQENSEYLNAFLGGG